MSSGSSLPCEGEGEGGDSAGEVGYDGTRGDDGSGTDALSSMTMSVGAFVSVVVVMEVLLLPLLFLWLVASGGLALTFATTARRRGDDVAPVDLLFFFGTVAAAAVAFLFVAVGVEETGKRAADGGSVCDGGDVYAFEA